MKKKFLTPFTVLAAAFTAALPATCLGHSAPDSALPSVINLTQPVVGVPRQDGRFSVKSNGDIFNFILKRSDFGEVLAQHESHASHASHSSHTSHYSSS
ncbi:His-Xaa-Ser repeat protein HxsA2 [Acidithiobacillus sp.]|uniref:His-Xaa-Ser repeat protein HxsA2 n=1 Tax=Acidithiobacillus sp. TaxID=1872118 RepID=UPI003D01FF55